MMRALACLALLVLLLAGCAGPKPAPPAGAAAALDPAAMAARIPAASVPAPTWVPGQWWEWSTLSGTEVSQDTFCSIVVAVDGNGYSVATEKTTMAKDEAAFGHPLLGAIGRDLSMDGFGGPWNVLSFPLTDGKTWTASIPNIAWDIIDSTTVDLTMTATFGIATHGEQPDIHLTGKSGDALLLAATYSPRTGWYSAFTLFDVDPGQEGIEIGFVAKSSGLNYTGPYFQHTAKPLLQLTDANGFTAPPPEGQPFANPQPTATFTASEGKTLYGNVWAETVAAARAIVLVDPNHQERHLESHSTDLDGSVSGLVLDEKAIPGEWRLTTTGAGGFSGTFAEIYEITEGNFQR